MKNYDPYICLFDVFWPIMIYSNQNQNLAFERTNIYSKDGMSEAPPTLSKTSQATNDN